jgi:hypothetical protein
LSAEKVKVEIFIPAGVCSCSIAPFMSSIWQVLIKYRSAIDYQLRENDSPEARKYGISMSGVVINGTVKLENFSIEELENAIRKFVTK